jgi:hypothetical protein
MCALQQDLSAHQTFKLPPNVLKIFAAEKIFEFIAACGLTVASCPPDCAVQR